MLVILYWTAQGRAHLLDEAQAVYANYLCKSVNSI